MASIYKPTRPGSDGKRIKCLFYRIAYIDEHGERKSVRGFKDKAATEALARRLERDVERKKAGLPVEDQRRRQEPLGPLMEQYLGELRRQDCSDTHLYEQRRLLQTLWRECGWNCLAAIRRDQLRTFLNGLQTQNRGPRTLNSYLDALKAFLNFCVGEGWMEENPIATMKRAKSKGKKTKPRRAYTLDEFQRLLTCAKVERKRRQIYTLAGLSGLRRSELRRLQKRDFMPVGDKPHWHLRPEIQKGRRADVAPMLPDVIPLARELWEALPKPTSKVFPLWPRHQTFDKDLERAGITKVDEHGRTGDFHSFRYFFCTLMAKRLPIQKVKVLMRHKRIRETADLYTDLGLVPCQVVSDG